MLFKCIVFCVFFGAVFSKESSGIPNLDHIFDSLSKEHWDEDETSCRDRIFSIMENVKNSTLWASWVWNSIDQSQSGIFYGARYHLGNYDQCINPPWLETHPELRTQYCLAEFEMNKDGDKTVETVTDPFTKAEDYYLKTQSPFGRSFSYIAHGVCVPAGCPTKSVRKFVKALVNTGYLQAAKDVQIDIHHCEEAGAKREFSRGFYIYVYTIAALLFMAVASTYYLIEYPVTANSDSFVNHIAKSFCLRRNWETVVKEDKDALTCLHGIRVLTAVLIAIIHFIALVHGTSVTNGMRLEQMLESPALAVAVVHFDVYVDTFFAMSAMLLAKNIATLDVTKPSKLFKNIMKRYIRLTGPYAVTVFYLAHVSLYTDNGPLYPKTAQFEQQTCEKNWWLSLLMVSNYFNTLEMCHPATWYIVCEFQFYVITLVLLYVYRKNPRVGKLAATIVAVAGFLGPAISTYIYDLPAVLTSNLGANIDIRPSKAFNYGYIRMHNRMGPYMAGLAAGYLMSIYKPKDYKKIWSKTVSFLGVMASLGLMLLVLGLGMLCYKYGVYGILACIFMIFNRTTFAVSVLGVIGFCTYGDVPLINSFLSWSFFAPLSRLTFGVYVVQLLILYRQVSSTRSHYTHNLFDIITGALGLVVVSLVLSLSVWLLVEAPLINFTNRYLNTKSSTNEKIASKKNGIYQNGSDKEKIK